MNVMGTIADGVAFSFLFSAGNILAIRTVVIMDCFVDATFHLECKWGCQ